jgi:hypothetical protein
MTMKIADVAPDEAQLVEISERLSEALTTDVPTKPATAVLDLDTSYLEAARTMLATLTERPRGAFHGVVALTEQQVKTYLDFDPNFLDVAKKMLREFIDRTESARSR